MGESEKSSYADIILLRSSFFFCGHRPRGLLEEMIEQYTNIV